MQFTTALVAAFVAVANAASCDMTSLETALTSTDATKCTSDSGYSMTSLTTPTGSEMSLMCTSSACLSVIKQLKTISPSECTLGTFALYANLITPLSSLCVGVSSSSASESSSTSRASVNTTTDTSNSVGTDNERSSSTSGSDSSSGYSDGPRTGTIIGIVTGAVMFLLVPVALFIVRRRQRNISNIPPANVNSSGRKQIEAGQILANKEYRGIQDSSGTTYPAGDSMVNSRSSLWEDPIIVTARVSIDRIKIGTSIGRGGFGEVFRGHYRDQDVAIKMLLPEKRKDLVQIESFLSEVRLMATMEHPHIVQFIGVAWESLSDLCCVTEFVAGGDLRTLLNNYKENNSSQGINGNKVTIAYQVAYALTYLHSLDPVVVHRDLKSRNILLTESLDAKITDFGTSRVCSNETMTAGVGSWMWMAPEVMLGEHYDEKADVFSFGVVLSEMDNHELPYFHTDSDELPDAAMMQMIAMGKLQVQFSRFMNVDMIRFARRCLSFNPQDRPTAAEVLYFFQKESIRR